MKTVIIESPFAGDKKKNVEYARRCMLDSLSRFEAPFASHLLYTQVLDDNNPKERETGMTAGVAWTPQSDLVAVYTDLGISKGMDSGIKRAKELGVPVEYRFINFSKTESEPRMLSLKERLLTYMAALSLVLPFGYIVLMLSLGHTFSFLENCVLVATIPVYYTLVFFLKGGSVYLKVKKGIRV